MSDIKFKYFDRKKVSEVGVAVISFVSVFLSLIIFAVATWLYLNPINKIDEEFVQNNSQLECMMLFNEFGFSANKIGENINVVRVFNEDPKLSITQFDSVMARCKNYALNGFCFGAEGSCQQRGLNAMLIYQPPFEYIKETN